MIYNEYFKGCVGCIDAGTSEQCCLFLSNHGRVRPVPALEGGGCLLKAKNWAEQAQLEIEHAWDQKKAKRLLDQDKTAKAVALAVGASPNAIKAMQHGNLPPKRPDKMLPEGPATAVWGNAGVPYRLMDSEAKRKGRVNVDHNDNKPKWKWVREKEFLPLYNAGMTDEQIGEAMGLKPQTIRLYRQRLRYPYIAKTISAPAGEAPAAEDDRREDKRREEKRREEKRREEKRRAAPSRARGESYAG